MAKAALPNTDKILPDTPLRLSVAAAIAFPDGSMTASGLRREAGRGNLIIERLAGKDYTTLANIEQMRAPCRVQAIFGERRSYQKCSTKFGEAVPAWGVPL
jgi:hypothetical protein